ncbi:MAG: acetyl-CoA hydrolase/transferase family protein [Porphyromonas sp.]|nr:acetyl-CoA hydrolase/transferase family protein [Porphyromonas sp.]
MALPFTTAQEAVQFIHHNDNVGFSGFTPAGCPKVVPIALAQKAELEHAAGRPFQVGMFTGASTGDHIDGALARAKAVKFRTPYQSNKDLRNSINAGESRYFDLHLSELAQDLRYGFLGDVDVAIIEAAEVTEEGQVVPTTGVGILPTICRLAKRVIIELNEKHPAAIRGLHDIAEPQDPPMRRDMPVYRPSDRVGLPYVQIPPEKIVAVVRTQEPNEESAFAPLDEVTQAIGNNVATFLAEEIRKGRIPADFLPIQSGVGNVANAVLGALGASPLIPNFEVYTEVIQDAVIKLMKEGRVTFASGCSLSVSRSALQDIYSDLDFFHGKLLLRPQEYSNNPEIVRRLGVITMNTALEADIYGNINSTHVCGTKMMNGIGGSGDFTRNGYLSIFTTPSVAKDGCISAFVPMVSHTDHTEHSVKVIASEFGVADLRGLSPKERAEAIIEQCAHPDYRPLLHQYLAQSTQGQTLHNLNNCFAFHKAFMETGDMRNVKF